MLPGRAAVWLLLSLWLMQGVSAWQDTPRFYKNERTVTVDTSSVHDKTPPRNATRTKLKRTDTSAFQCPKPALITNTPFFGCIERLLSFTLNIE